jgi:hypothetical protein
VLAATSGIVALIATVSIMHGLTAQPRLPQAVLQTPTDAQRCLSEGWHFEAGAIRDQVIGQCLELLRGER